MRECGGLMTTYSGKRLFDVVASSAACAAFAPLGAVIATAIWLEDSGSPLFVQQRVGRGRETFEVLKFRSMRDEQVTRVGRWLRRTGLDELPQFLNVLRGDMSIVGPRPLTPADLERLGWDSERSDWRFDYRPGITGLSQLFSGEGAEKSEQLDRRYLDDQTIGLDARIVCLSFAVNVFGKRRVKAWIRELASLE